MTASATLASRRFSLRQFAALAGCPVASVRTAIAKGLVPAGNLGVEDAAFLWCWGALNSFQQAGGAIRVMNQAREVPLHVRAAIRPLRIWSLNDFPTPAWLVVSISDVAVVTELDAVNAAITAGPDVLVINLARFAAQISAFEGGEPGL